MRTYEDVLREIDELLSHIEETKKEIAASTILINQTRSALDDANGPGLEAYRQSLIEELRDLKEDRDWWYDEKEISYIRLKELRSEKIKFEDPNWRQINSNNPSCNKTFWYRIDWQHIPNYCPNCKRNFRN